MEDNNQNEHFVLTKDFTDLIEGEQIKFLLIQKQKTIQELAEEIGISQYKLLGIVNGYEEPSIKTKEKLSNLLGFDPFKKSKIKKVSN